MDAVEVWTIGPRAAGLARVRRTPEPAFIIVAGLAGGLDPGLVCGEIVIDGSPVQMPGVRAGRIHTADRIVTTPASKAELFRTTGALAVDMEQALVVRAFPGVPVIGLRAILDTAERTLPGFLEQWVNSNGSVRFSAVALHVVLRPWMINELIVLGSDTDRALKSLGDSVSHLVPILRGSPR
jgi:nucleoside phosphorylase